MPLPAPLGSGLVALWWPGNRIAGWAIPLVHLTLVHSYIYIYMLHRGIHAYFIYMWNICFLLNFGDALTRFSERVHNDTPYSLNRLHYVECLRIYSILGDLRIGREILEMKLNRTKHCYFLIYIIYTYIWYASINEKVLLNTQDSRLLLI